jgi:hypothetical protein
MIPHTPAFIEIEIQIEIEIDFSNPQPGEYPSAGRLIPLIDRASHK